MFIAAFPFQPQVSLTKIELFHVMKKFRFLFAFAVLTLAAFNTSFAQIASQWSGKSVAYLGDSMTDPRNSSANVKYWNVLEDEMGIKPYVFARSGYEWKRLLSKAEEMRDSVGDKINAVIIWCGTNDFNHNVPLGEFFSERMDSVNHNGKMKLRKHRSLEMNDSTFAGNINRVMSYLKENFPDRQVIIMTPIHRGYANFSEKNVQPDENYANDLGLYIEDYVHMLRQAADVWAVPLIDMYSLSGIYPNFDSNIRYISKKDTDRLHPNNEGHRRIARTMQAQLMALPVDFN